MTKNCTRCGETKAFDCFYKSRTSFNSICKECIKSRSREWYSENREKALSYSAEWRAKNLEYAKKKQAEYSKKNSARIMARVSEWQSNNKERVKDYKASYRKNNQSYYVAKCSDRRAIRLKATLAWANGFFIGEIYDLARRRSRCLSGGVKWHVDHIVPLQSPLVCGLHVEHNLQVIPATLNHKKKNVYWPDMP